jgi:hypothetical protein
MVDDLEEALDEVLALKASGKSARVDEDWEGALGDLGEAVDLLRSRTASTSRSRSRLAAELADTYGVIGGIHKRWGLPLKGEKRGIHLRESVAAYDEGFRYERDLPPNEANTYNRINRLVGRVLLDPAVLNGGADGAPVNVSSELHQAEEILTEQLETVRQRDPWAYCDLGTIKLLLGAADAMSTLHDLDRLRPPAFVYESWLTTLEPLAEVASTVRPVLLQAVEHVRRSARYAE